MATYQIKTELIQGIKPKKFRKQGKYHYYIRVYIDTNSVQKSLNDIELVKYTLHPTFVNPIRVSSSVSSKFDIKIWSYGFFNITALLLLRNGSTQEVKGYVEWKIPEGMPFDDDE